MSPLIRFAALFALVAACSDSADEPATRAEPTEQPSAPASPASPPSDPSSEPPSEPPSELPDSVQEAVAALPVRAPAGRVLPELDSVRWGPDRREAFESMEDLDAMFTAHLGRASRVAARMRARHGRDRITLAIVLSLKEEPADEVDQELISEVIQFEGPAITDEAQAVDRREGNVGEHSEKPCRCGAEVETNLLLVRVVHGETNRIDQVVLPADVCSGRDAELRLADFDRDGRVELRADISYHTDVSCGAQSEMFTRLYVVDIADLVLQSNIVTIHDQERYFSGSTFHGRARFTALDEDEHPDIEVTGRGVDASDDDTLDDEPSRFAIRQSWLYDVALDTWERQGEI